MVFKVLTIFPSYFKGVFDTGLIKNAIKKNKIKLKIYNLRDFTEDKHRSVDDYPYGGGAGMVMKIEPVYRAIKKLKGERTKVILLSPKGKVLNQKKMRELSKEDELLLVCGRYKGYDARIEFFVDEVISIGDYVVSGGEVGALILIEGITRLLEGTVGDRDSVESDSFEDGLLEGPQFTRPENFMGYRVPEILLSGDHEKIRKWRLKKRVELTLKRRPDLIRKGTFSDEILEILKEVSKDESYR